MWLVALLIVAAAGVTWMLVQNGASMTAAEEVAPAPALAGSERAAESLAVTGPRAADAFSAELDALRQFAASVASQDGATAHGVSLAELSATGRQAYVANRMADTANGYAVYLDGLRRQGQAAQRAVSRPADANAFSAWLDQLRRMSQ
jgi:hypothetical protein